MTQHQDLRTSNPLIVKTNRSVQKIAVVRALPGLGDFLCVIPALRALRAVHLNAHITLIGLPNLRGLVERFGVYIDELVELPGYPGLPEQPSNLEALPQFLNKMRSRQFDWAIQMHGSGVVTNSLTTALEAQRSTGFFMPGHLCPDVETFLPYRESESEIRRYLRLMEFLGIPSQGEELEFPLHQADWQEWETLTTLYSIQQGRYVCIHAGASVPARCWAGSHFATVGDELAQMGWQIVLTGSVAERGLADVVAQTMNASAVNLAGRTSLGALAALLQGARLLICNDTGVSHLAAALKVPSVVVFSGSDPQRWAPLERKRHRAIEPPATVTTVLNQVHELLQEPTYVA